jgi:hypothetical protein
VCSEGETVGGAIERMCAAIFKYVGHEHVDDTALEVAQKMLIDTEQGLFEAMNKNAEKEAEDRAKKEQMLALKLQLQQQAHAQLQIFRAQEAKFKELQAQHALSMKKIEDEMADLKRKALDCDAGASAKRRKKAGDASRNSQKVVFFAS